MSIDPASRWGDVARVLVAYSTAVARNDHVLVIMRESSTFPLVRAIHAEAVRAGALPQILFTSTLLERDKMAYGSNEQVGWVPELFRAGMEWADVCIDVRGATSLYEFADIDPALIGRHRKAEGIISALRTESTRWVIIRVPNETLAQQARRSTDTVMNLFFDACLQDWPEESRRLRAMASELTGTSTVRIEAEGCDLTFSTAGRRYVAEDGHINLPGGELFTSPVEESAEGHITFRDPGVFAGVLMEGIRLEFERGAVVAASARTNEAFLRELIGLDAGARRIGEFGIGTNRGLTFFSNDILFDEKIFGTIHLALGRSYKECGGCNDSALHWDIIEDLRPGGTVAVDGRTIIENGSLLL